MTTSSRTPTQSRPTRMTSATTTRRIYGEERESDVRILMSVLQLLLLRYLDLAYLKN
jgi:hypothetical protein